VKNLTAELK
jgi:importin subunit beta-1